MPHISCRSGCLQRKVYHYALIATHTMYESVSIPLVHRLYEYTHFDITRKQLRTRVLLIHTFYETKHAALIRQLFGFKHLDAT